MSEKNFALDNIFGISETQDDKEIVCIDDKPGDKYYLVIEKGPRFALIFPFKKNHEGAKVQHPNIAGTRDKTLEFKHYHPDGGKHWTSEAGIEHAVIVPREKVEFLHEKGYSYPKVKINGVTFDLNTSGGSYKDGWGDFIPLVVSTVCNLPVEQFKTILEVAIPRKRKEQRIKEEKAA